MKPDPENTVSLPAAERGVYVLANDKTGGWFQLFVRSFRRTNPTLPLTLIPFDQNVGCIQKLQEEFAFDILDVSACSHYDVLAKKVRAFESGAGKFRRLACFNGKYREFLYLDADIATLMPLDELFDAFAASSAEFVYFDTSMEWCYSGKLAAEMVAKYGSPAFNSGAFLSRRGVLSDVQIFAAADAADAVSENFVTRGDQPFVNYVVDINRVRHSSLEALDSRFSDKLWARQPFVYDEKTNIARNDKGKLIPLIHWAGCPYPFMVRPEVFLSQRTYGLSFFARIRFITDFYCQRNKIVAVKFLGHLKTVLFKFFTNWAWVKFYLGKLVGIKVKTPD